MRFEVEVPKAEGMNCSIRSKIDLYMLSTEP